MFRLKIILLVIVLLHVPMFTYASDVALLSDENQFIESLGCWKDSKPRALSPGWERGYYWKDTYKTRSDAIEKCMRVAVAQKSRIFAVQDGGYCFIKILESNEAYKQYGPSSNCLR